MKHSSMFYSALSYQAYTLVTQPGTGFHPTFYAHLLRINEAIERNLTRQARYLSELAIRMYGTHVITSANVGAYVERMDFVDKSLTNSSEQTVQEMKVAAAISFAGASATFGHESRVSESTWQAFEMGKTHSVIKTNGGPDASRLLKYGWDNENRTKVGLVIAAEKSIVT